MNLGWWDSIAFALQSRNRETESEKPTDLYTDEQARRAAVYTREDIALIASYLSSANRQLHQIKSLLVAIGVGVAMIAILTIFLTFVVCLRSA